MLQVQMTDDIRKYETKAIGPFTFRQAVCGFAGLMFGLIMFSLIKIDALGLRISIAALLATPIILCGWIQLDGMYLEVLGIRLIYYTVLTPAKRKAKNHCIYKECFSMLRKEAEKEKLAQMSKKEQKKYEEQKAKKKKVKYYSEGPYKLYS